ncbi:hypothetical protein [Nocardioides pacificus]
MNRQSEDDAWRAIVENYGDRAEVDTSPTAEPDPDAEADTGPEAEETQDLVTAGPGDFPAESAETDEGRSRRDMLESGYADDDSFVPPPPPPLPHVPLPRLVSWVGLLGSPALLLVCLIAGISLPQWLAYLLVVGFVGGFAYLVVHMPRQRQDPWDDGAVL